MTQAQASLDTTRGSGVAGRARAARIGAGVALLAMALVTYGAYGVQDSARVVPLTPDSAKADMGKTASGSFASLRTTENL